MLAIHGPRSNYLSNLGIALRSLGRTAEAINAPRRAAELDPASADIQFNLGNACQDAGEFAQAVEAFRAAVVRNPHHAAAWSGLGESQRETRDFDESRGCHECAISLRRARPMSISTSV